MITVNSLSGGQTSSYIAANYPADYNLFALVRTSDERCRFKDDAVRRLVEDKLQAPFIATAEDDMIIYTMLDLEQFIGQKIHWVTSKMTFEDMNKQRGFLPNKNMRFCTSILKIEPMVHWWAKHLGEPVEVRIGFRASEQSRANTTMEKTNEDGLSVFETTFEKHIGGRFDGKNKWEKVAWQKPVFPLIQDAVFKDKIVEYWKDKPVRFAKFNNCVHCFERNPIMIRKMAETHHDKIQWAIDQEKQIGGCWRSDFSYSDMIKRKMQIELNFEDFSECDSGYCEVN
jgi:hypothetical protein